MSPSAIEVDHLSHRYGSRVALNDVTLNVPAGKVAALLGPNGGGKTTLFKILATLMRPSDGTARLCGHDVRTAAGAVRRCIGVTFQSPSLDLKLTVRENLKVNGHLYGLRGAALRERIDALLAEFRIADRARDFCEVLSGGLRRRVEIAKALMHAPAVLLLDEPSTGLDPAARCELSELFRRLAAGGVTVFLTTHLMEEAEPCDAVAIIDAGRLVAMDAPEVLCRSIGGDVITFETDAPQELARHIGSGAVVAGGTVRVEHEAGHRFAAETIESWQGRIQAVHVGRPTLADVFMQATGRSLEGADEAKAGAVEAAPAA